MKTSVKSVSGFALAGILMLLVVFIAQAQRGGRMVMRGGGPRIGFGFGFGGPRIGFGFGYRPLMYSYPRIGFYVNSLPYGYYPFYYGSDMYYYWGGNFYRPYNDGYQVTAPPVGAAVPSLPRGANPITIDGQQYFEANGVYYKEGVDDKGKRVFIVSGKDGVLNTDKAGMPADSVYNGDEPANRYLPRIGDIVTQLPEGTHKVTLGGKKYYVDQDDVYYEEFKDANDNTSYRVARLPEQEDAEPAVAPQEQRPAPKPVKPGTDI